MPISAAEPNANRHVEFLVFYFAVVTAEKPISNFKNMSQPANCFFLRLPIEVRLIIYDYVFDSRTLHISSAREGTHKLCHRLCVCENFSLIEASVYRYAWLHARNRPERPIHIHTGLDRMSSRYDMPDTWLMHYSCLLSKNREAYSIALVKTCKQVYNEAILVPYQKSTFSFDDQRTLKRFLMAQDLSYTAGLAQAKRRAIRSLQLHAMYFNWSDVHEWNSASHDVVKHLDNLEHLELCIDFAFHDCRVFDKIHQTNDFFTAFHELPLKTLKVNVIDPSFGIYVMRNSAFQRLQQQHRLSFMAKDLLRSAITKKIRTRPPSAIGLVEMEAWDP